MEIAIRIGEDVQPTPDGDRYLGFTIARPDPPSKVVDGDRVDSGSTASDVTQ
ncbi:MAG TPA: hypothetical protein VLN74_11780 [Ilumatobacteraceae bacterium]|nr:hypothetical protein [Ilumatobacteraceae bacterium]